MMKPYIGDTFDDTEFDTLIRSAYESFDHPARCPLVQLEPWLFLLELYHGPTSGVQRLRDAACRANVRRIAAKERREGDDHWGD